MYTKPSFKLIAINYLLSSLYFLGLWVCLNHLGFQVDLYTSVFVFLAIWLSVLFIRSIVNFFKYM